MTNIATELVTGRTLLAPELFARVSQRISTDEPMDLVLAERVLDQALVFLATAAHHHGPSLSPSATVDIGWHTFILYTRGYADFCNRVGGGFIHHEPHERETEPTRVALARTIEAIRAAGFQLDEDLWINIANCGSTGCHSGPPPGA